MTNYSWPPLSVSVAPTAGSATEAKQDDQIALATALNAKDFATSTKQDAQTSILNTIDADTGALVLKDFATSAKQDTGNASLSTIAGKDFSTSAKQDTMITATGSLTETAPASDTASSGLNGRLQRIAQRITSLIALFPTALGQALMSASFPVVIASNQSAIPTTTSVVDPTASGTITTQNLVPAGTATANSAVEISLSGQGTVAVQVTGTYTGALSAQGTVDGTTWVTLSSLMNVNTGALLASITSALQGIFQVETAGFNKIRITGLAAVTGTATVSLRATRQASLVGLDSPLPAGANIIGALTANQSSNVSQINGVTPLMGNGTTGTGSLRVTLASDTSSNTNALLFKAGGKTRANAPVRNDYTSVSVTTAAYVQLVASLTSACTEVEIFDSSGQTLVIATGAAASEVDQAIIIPGGNGRIPLAIAAATRVSIKALSGTASVGEIDVNFYT